MKASAVAASTGTSAAGAATSAAKGLSGAIAGAAAAAPVVATSPSHQKALDAKSSMEAAKAACAKVPKPGLPHYTWAKNSEAKGAQALESKDWPKAEKAYTDAKLFYEQAAGKK